MKNHEIRHLIQKTLRHRQGGPTDFTIYRCLKILKALKLLEWSVAKKGTIILPWLCRQPKRPSKLPHNHHRAASKLNLEHRLT